MSKDENLEFDGLDEDENKEVVQETTEPQESEVEEPEDSEFNELYVEHEGKIEDALFEYCFKHNIFYDNDIVDSLAKSPSYIGAKNRSQIYIDTLNASPKYKGDTFFDQLRRDNFKKIYSESLSASGLTEEDKKNRQQIFDIVGYDPFKDEAPNLKPQLYRDLVGMLSDNMRKDIAKQKAAISVVRSYCNIEKYQKMVNDLMNSPDAAKDEVQDTINSYLNLINKIQTSINQTAKENNFTVKGIGSNGRGMLSDVMNQIEERGIDLGTTNFYDIATSESIGQIAEVSWKSMLNQVNLSRTDYADIIADQAELVRKAQETAMKAMEGMRLAKEKITNQTLLEKLEEDYRRKGISEEDIKEFLDREITMYELT